MTRVYDLQRFMGGPLLEGASLGRVSLLLDFLNVLLLLGLDARGKARGRKARATIQIASSRSEGMRRAIRGGISKRRGWK
jgi:hypothetical protein